MTKPTFQSIEVEIDALFGRLLAELATEPKHVTTVFENIQEVLEEIDRRAPNDDVVLLEYEVAVLRYPLLTLADKALGNELRNRLREDLLSRGFSIGETHLALQVVESLDTTVVTNVKGDIDVIDIEETVHSVLDERFPPPKLALVLDSILTIMANELDMILRDVASETSNALDAVRRGIPHGIPAIRANTDALLVALHRRAMREP